MSSDTVIKTTNFDYSSVVKLVSILFGSRVRPLLNGFNCGFQFADNCAPFRKFNLLRLSKRHLSISAQLPQTDFRASHQMKPCRCMNTSSKTVSSLSEVETSAWEGIVYLFAERFVQVVISGA